MTHAASNGHAALTSPPPAEPVAIPHAEGLALFDTVLENLVAAGWIKYRVDTYVRPGHARDSMTVRHHYDHGTWELWFEKDRYWFAQQPLSTVRRALIRLDRPLPTPREVLSQLFGEQFTTYAKVPIPSDK
jgi:hypothetical protein